MIDTQIEHQGGWRLVMQNQLDWSNSIHQPVDVSFIRNYPHTALAKAFLLAKWGQTQNARNYLDKFKSIWETQKHPITIAMDLALVDAHTCVYEDKELQEAELVALLDVLQRQASSDLIGQALVANHLSTFALHAGEIDKSQKYAQRAIQLYRQGSAEYGSLHMYAHLGQIHMLRGDLNGAAKQYLCMEESANSTGTASECYLQAIGRALRAEVAYEMNNLRGSSQLLQQSLPIVEAHDAWIDVLVAAYKVKVRLAFLEGGLPAALSQIVHANGIAELRGMPRLQRIMQLEKIRALTLGNELNAAESEVQKIDQYALEIFDDTNDQFDSIQCLGIVILLRFWIRRGRERRALSVIKQLEGILVVSGKLLIVAKLRVLKALAHWQLGEQKQAKSAMIQGLALLGEQPFRRFVLDEGETAQSLVSFILQETSETLQFSRVTRKRLQELSFNWSRGESALGHSSSRINLPLHKTSKSQQQCCLELLEQGFSNHEIAKTMGISINTVKYHLKNLYRIMGVNNRASAVRLLCSENNQEALPI